MRFIDLPFVRRLEMAEAIAGRACAQAVQTINPESHCAFEEIAGGIAVFAGPDSPVTQAIGVGLAGTVSESELDRLEEFFLSRGAPVAVELCPFLDPSVVEKLGKQPYRIAEFSNVLFREIEPGQEAGDPFGGVTVREAAPGEAGPWSQTVAQGFAEHFPVTPSLLGLMEGFFRRPGAQCFIAFVDGKVAGGGAVAAHDGIGGLFGASTLPEFRRRGVQTALLRARVAWALAHGCDMAMSIAPPGSASHRNLERAGFRVAYTRTKVIRDLPSSR